MVMSMDVASNELLEALIRSDELILMRLGEPPRDADAARHWTKAHDALRAELQQLQQRKAQRAGRTPA
jgi:hypothetical protein